MRIVLDRKDIEEAIVTHIKAKFDLFDADVTVIQGKTATATVTITKEDNGDDKEEH